MATLGSVQQELINMQSNTAVNQAKERAASGASQELDGDAFLMLMLEQLKNQDPMNPMDNSEMLAQQAQFTQLTELQEMNETMATNNMIQQANSLVGKTVQIVDPNNTSRLITGVVTSANFSGDSASITVNGQQYPLGLVAAITDGAAASDATTIANKKLSDLNNASGITDGYITLTVEDEKYKKTNTEIKITGDMTVADLQKEIEKAGLKTKIENGVLTIEKGDNKSIVIAQGKLDGSSPCNLVEKMQMFRSGGSSSEGNTEAQAKSTIERILSKIFD